MIVSPILQPQFSDVLYLFKQNFYFSVSVESELILIDIQLEGKSSQYPFDEIHVQ